MKLRNLVLSLIAPLHISTGDENKPASLRGEDGCLGLGVCWGCRVSCGRTVGADAVLGAEEARSLSQIQTPSSVGSPND